MCRESFDTKNVNYIDPEEETRISDFFRWEGQFKGEEAKMTLAVLS